MKITGINGKIWLALKQRLDEWDETPIYYPFQEFAPEANQAFLVVDPASLDPGIASIDFTCGKEHRGFLNVRVMTPLQWDYAATTGLMDRIADHMMAGWVGTYQDATVQVWDVSQGAASPITEAAWHRLDVRIDWRCWG